MSRTSGLTYADLASFPDDGLRRELLDGELLVSPSPVTRHQSLVRRLIVAIAIHIDRHGGGKVHVAPLDVVLEPGTVLEPDLLFVTDDQTGIITDKNVQGPPTLVIEVLSDPKRDRILKRDAYARHGVLEYWIVDPDADRVEVYKLAPGTSSYGKPALLQPGETLTTSHLPGLEIELTALFASD